MSLKSKIKGIARKVLKPKSRLAEFQCPICLSTKGFNKLPDEYLNKYIEHGMVYSVSDFETLNIQQYSCCNCGSSDRDRLMAMFLKGHLQDKLNSELSVLDFAPSKPIQLWLKKFPLNYQSADLFMEGVDHKVDIRNMEIFKNESFDLFICSHVLEHIDEDLVAMKELYRISKPNAIGVLLVPIMLSLDNSVEDKEYLESDHLRWKYFGQDDHVRMYSKGDFVCRLEAAGFKVRQLGKEHFGQKRMKQAGVLPKSILYIAEK